jgi:hypothetical protein
MAAASKLERAKTGLTTDPNNSSAKHHFACAILNKDLHAGFLTS